jgi:hypothetical protein
MESVSIDHVTVDPQSGEYVLYVVEDGPWPTLASDIDLEKHRIQRRIIGILEAVIGGSLASAMPETRGKAVRLQVDSPSGLPNWLQESISGLRSAIIQNIETKEQIKESPHVAGLRLVTGHELGRFIGKNALQ